MHSTVQSVCKSGKLTPPSPPTLPSHRSLPCRLVPQPPAASGRVVGGQTALPCVSSAALVEDAGGRRAWQGGCGRSAWAGSCRRGSGPPGWPGCAAGKGWSDRRTGRTQGGCRLHGPGVQRGGRRLQRGAAPGHDTQRSLPCHAALHRGKAFLTLSRCHLSTLGPWDSCCHLYWVYETSNGIFLGPWDSCCHLPGPSPSI